MACLELEVGLDDNSISYISDPCSYLSVVRFCFVSAALVNDAEVPDMLKRFRVISILSLVDIGSNCHCYSIMEYLYVFFQIKVFYLL